MLHVGGNRKGVLYIFACSVGHCADPFLSLGPPLPMSLETSLKGGMIILNLACERIVLYMKQLTCSVSSLLEVIKNPTWIYTIPLMKPLRYYYINPMPTLINVRFELKMEI